MAGIFNIESSQTRPSDELTHASAQAEQACHRPVRIEISQDEVDAEQRQRAEGGGGRVVEEDTGGLGASGGRSSDGAGGSSRVVHKAMRAGVAARPAIIADILAVDAPRKTIIFTNTKLETVTLAGELGERAGGGRGSGAVSSFLVLHGDLPQFQRTRVMEDFKKSEQGVLIATDVAARGIHVQDLDLVIHCGVPVSASGAARRAKTSKADVVNVEQFVHRTGRTGRMGASGTSLLLFDPTAGETALLPVLERSIGDTFAITDAPAADARARAAGDLATRRIAAVSEEAAQLFDQDAQALLDNHGPRVLARALAALGGLTQPLPARSLLDGREGFRTVCAHARVGRDDKEEGRGVTPSDVTEELRAALGVKKIGRVSLCADGGAVVDVTEPQAQQLLSWALPPSSAISRFSLPDALPVLQKGKQAGGGKSGPGGDSGGR